MILFDLSAAQPLTGGNHGGGEYTRAVFHKLVADGAKDQLLLLVDQNRDVPPDIEAAIDTYELSCIPFASNSDLQEILDSGRGQRFFSALPYNYDDLDFRDYEVIFTVHGLRPIETPTDSLEVYYAGSIAVLVKWIVKQLFTGLYKKKHIRKFQSLVSTAARKVSIIVPSEHTRTAIHEHLTVPETVSTHVLYSPSTGVAEETDADTDALREFGLSAQKYLLIVSGNRWIKNSYRALRAIQLLADRNEAIQKFDIVVAGGLHPRIRKKFNQRLNVLPYIDQRKLRALYENAYALIYPTLNEGFGYPPLEAMSCRTAVVSSDVCSLPEIAGDAPLYASPRSAEEIAERILELLEDEEKWQSCRTRGFARWKAVRARQLDDLSRLSEIIRGDA